MDVRYLNLACCGVEAGSAAARTATAALADRPGPSILVVAGTVTHANRSVLDDAVGAIPEPRLVVAYGVCTISGGPYWDSYAVDNIEADIVVPGCPPRPDALVAAIEQALQ